MNSQNAILLLAPNNGGSSTTYNTLIVDMDSGATISHLHPVTDPDMLQNLLLDAGWRISPLPMPNLFDNMAFYLQKL